MLSFVLTFAPFSKAAFTPDKLPFFAAFNKDLFSFAVCIFAVGEDGTRYLVDHRHAENMGECIKKRREAVNKYKDPKHRELMGGTRFMFMCDKVKAEVEILEDGTWHIIKILGRYEPAYKKKKSYN